MQTGIIGLALNPARPRSSAFSRARTSTKKPRAPQLTSAWRKCPNLVWRSLPSSIIRRRSHTPRWSTWTSEACPAIAARDSHLACSRRSAKWTRWRMCCASSTILQVPHPAGSVDPLRDAVSLDLELMLSDLDQVDCAAHRARGERPQEKERAASGAGARAALALPGGHSGRNAAARVAVHAGREEDAGRFHVPLRAADVLYVLNLGDDEAPRSIRPSSAMQPRKAIGQAAGRAPSWPSCGRIEAELAELEDAAAAELLSAYGLKEPGLHRLIRATYELLGLISFFTAGEPEVRAWTIRCGTNAQKAAAAAIQHTFDIERGFIRAESGALRRFAGCRGGIPAAREKGAGAHLEGKEYVVQEGDVILVSPSSG